MQSGWRLVTRRLSLKKVPLKSKQNPLKVPFERCCCSSKSLTSLRVNNNF